VSQEQEPIDPSTDQPPSEHGGGEHAGSSEDDIVAHEAKMRKHAKKEKRKANEPPAHDDELNIVALMDAFTIILVFLIKSYASDPTQITQGDEVKLPTSTTHTMIPEAVPLVVSKKGILVDNQAVVRVMDDGLVDPSEKQGVFIPRLAEALKKQADHHKMIARYNTKVKFEGLLLVVADKNTKFTTLTDVLYTAGQVEFGQFKFAVLKNE